MSETDQPTAVLVVTVQPQSPVRTLITVSARPEVEQPLSAWRVHVRGRRQVLAAVDRFLADLGVEE